MVTTISAEPEPAGVRQVISNGDTTVTEVALAPPIVTVAPSGSKPVPAMVTNVPPTVGPVAGEIEATVGATLIAASTVISTEWAE